MRHRVRYRVRYGVRYGVQYGAGAVHYGLGYEVRISWVHTKQVP